MYKTKGLNISLCLFIYEQKQENGNNRMEINEENQLTEYIQTKLAEAPKLVKNHIEKNGKKLKFRRCYGRLKKHVDDFLSEYGGEERLILLPGLRGTGKTTLVYQIYDYLKNNKKIEQDRILYLSTDELKAYMGRDILSAVRSFIEDTHNTSLVNLDKKVFIMIDEAHFDRKWSETAKIIFDKNKNIFLLFTGSSALDLEINVDSARRIKKESLYPLNFSEYIILKYGVFPEKGTSEALRKAIFKGQVKEAIEKEKQLNKEIIKIGNPIKNELKNFLHGGGFPFSMYENVQEARSKILDMTERIIEKDVFTIKDFKTDTRNTITRILTFLSLQGVGGTSDSKLAKRLNKSPSLIRSILEVLEKTHLVFNIKPYGSAGKIVNKPWQYYFLSPSLNTSFRFKFGSKDFKSNEMNGILSENLVASYLMRMKKTKGYPTSIFYDSEKGGVDFLIQKNDEKIIPIEVGYGKKNRLQIQKAIRKYKSGYGIVICDCPRIKKDGKIIFIPLKTFAFL